MIELKTEYFNKFIKHYAEDENGVKYKIKQNETGIVYDEAVDLIPCKYTYSVTKNKVEEVLDE